MYIYVCVCVFLSLPLLYEIFISYFCCAYKSSIKVATGQLATGNCQQLASFDNFIHQDQRRWLTTGAAYIFYFIIFLEFLYIFSAFCYFFLFCFILLLFCVVLQQIAFVFMFLNSFMAFFSRVVLVLFCSSAVIAFCQPVGLLVCQFFGLVFSWRTLPILGRSHKEFNCVNKISATNCTQTSINE